MIDSKDLEYLLQPVSTIAQQDVATMRADSTVQEALNSIRAHGIGERIVYFYVVDDSSLLAGVIPTRRLLTASLEKRVSDIMIKQVETIQEEATILAAHEALINKKLLALPVVDPSGHIKGVVDLGMFAKESIDAFDREKVEEIFELVGLRLSQMRESSPLKSFRFRFPWLMATIASGTICAVLASIFDVTLAKSLELAFFLTLVLGLGESVSMQSMTVTIHKLHVGQPTIKRYMKILQRELSAAALLGAGCGSLVGCIVWLWRGPGMPAVAIGGSLFFVIFAAGFWGATVPNVLHMTKLDPKIAAGPVTLALADIGTVLIYFGLATILL